MKTILLAILLCIVTFTGCVTILPTRNNKKLLDLEIGDTKSQVLELMGNPDKNEKYWMTENDYDILFYRKGFVLLFHTSDDDDEFTPVVLVNGKVIGWGKDFYDNSVKTKLKIGMEQSEKQTI